MKDKGICAIPECTRKLMPSNRNGYCVTCMKRINKRKQRGMIPMIIPKAPRTPPEVKERLEALEREAVSRYYADKRRGTQGMFTGRLQGNVGANHQASNLRPVRYSYEELTR